MNFNKFSYQRCCPDEGSGSKISNLLQYISSGIGHTPKIVMFGPGLDTKTSKVVRSIIMDEKMSDVGKPVAKFLVTGMVPGAAPGGLPILVQLIRNLIADQF